MGNLFQQCHGSEKLFVEMVLRQMVKQLPHWKDNEKLMKLELLRATECATFYDDDLFNQY
jgi:hypothetical protein